MTRDPWDAYQTDDPTQWAGREVLPEDDHDLPGAAALVVVAALVVLVAAFALAAWVTFR